MALKRWWPAAAVLGSAVAVTGCGVLRAPVWEVSADRSAMHMVRRGETLYSIAWAANLDYRAVAQWNDIRPPYLIKSGQHLRLTRPARSKARPPARPRPQQALQRGWGWPAEGRVSRRFSTKFRSTGIDIAGRRGQPIRAAAAGRVVYRGSGLRGYGKLIIIKHNETFLSAYAHNDTIAVREGETVGGGQRIASMGSTGTDRTKLHFEIRRYGVPVDPLRYLARRRP